MTEAKPAKITYAQQRIAYLRSVAAQMEAFSGGDPDGPRDVEKAIGVDLDAQHPEIVETCREVGVEPPIDKYGPIRNVHVAIRAWERADSAAETRIAMLRAWLAEVRALRELEVRRDGLRSMASPLTSPPALTKTDAEVSDLRDRLGTEQHEIETLLNAVGRTLKTHQLARGANGIVDFVAGEIAAAVGAYREWPATACDPDPTIRPGEQAEVLQIGDADQVVARVKRAVDKALRPAFRDRPKLERDVQDVVATILRAIEIPFRRERESAPVGPTSFKPDFTFGEGLALEIKLARENHGEADVQHELAEDVAGYKTRWKRLFAIIYDADGSITDPEHLKAENEAHFGVTVIVIKH